MDKGSSTYTNILKYEDWLYMMITYILNYQLKTSQESSGISEISYLFKKYLSEKFNINVFYS